MPDWMNRVILLFIVFSESVSRKYQTPSKSHDFRLDIDVFALNFMQKLVFQTNSGPKNQECCQFLKTIYFCFRIATGRVECIPAGAVLAVMPKLKARLSIVRTSTALAAIISKWKFHEPATLIVIIIKLYANQQRTWILEQPHVFENILTRLISPFVTLCLLSFVMQNILNISSQKTVEN